MDRKVFLVRTFSLAILILIILLAILNHATFFLRDNRPFIDHDIVYYNYFGFLYPLLKRLVYFFSLGRLSSSIFIYKMISLAYFIPLIIVTYLIGKENHNRAVGLLASFFVSTFPFVLNVYRKSDVNIPLTTVTAVCLYLLFKSNNFNRRLYAILLGISLLVLGWLHYSSVLYIIPIFCLSVINLTKNKKHKNSIINFSYFLLLFLGVIGIIYLYPGLISSDIYLSYPFACERYGITYTTITSSIFSKTFFIDFLRVFLTVKNLLPPSLNFYFYLSILVILYTCVRFTKVKFSHFTESSYLIFIALNLLLFNLLFSIINKTTKESLEAMFLVPAYIPISLLNAVAIYELYSKLSQKKLLKILFNILMGSIFFYGILISFAAGQFLGSKVVEGGKWYYHNAHYCYYPLEDDFGLAGHLKYFKEKYAGDKQVKYTISTFDNAGLNPHLKSFAYLFSLTAEMNDLFQFTFAPSRELFAYFSTSFKKKLKHNSAEFIVYLYDRHAPGNESKGKQKEDTEIIREKLLAEISERFGVEIRQKCIFKKVIPYGPKIGSVRFAEEQRRYLTFIFLYRN